MYMKHVHVRMHTGFILEQVLPRLEVLSWLYTPELFRRGSLLTARDVHCSTSRAPSTPFLWTQWKPSSIYRICRTWNALTRPYPRSSNLTMCICTSIYVFVFSCVYACVCVYKGYIYQIYMDIVNIAEPVWSPTSIHSRTAREMFAYHPSCPPAPLRYSVISTGCW